MALAAVRDLREWRPPVGSEELAGYETDVLAGFVLARASAGLVDSTIRADTSHLEMIRSWFGRPLWEMTTADADAYFGTALRAAPASTRTNRAGTLTVFFQYLELRHRAELHNLTGRLVEPADRQVGIVGSKSSDFVVIHRAVDTADPPPPGATANTPGTPSLPTELQ